jgi:DNA-binding NtrC family response regulator
MIRIAVVDDDRQITAMLEKFLKRNDNYRVTLYNNPVTALSAIERSVDVILLDIMMPQMNGLDFLAKIKKKYPHVNVIMMTAYSTLDKVLDSHRYGAQHYLMKPFTSLDAVSNKIDEVTI